MIMETQGEERSEDVDLLSHQLLTTPKGLWTPIVGRHTTE